jgi:antirestriction protein ArdC
LVLSCFGAAQSDRDLICVDHAAYIASWIKVLKNDKRAIFSTASHAQRAADFLYGLQKSASPQADAA